MGVFTDLIWLNANNFAELRDKFNNAMALADSIPVAPIGVPLPWYGNPNDVALWDITTKAGKPGTTMANFALCLGQDLTGSLIKNYDGTTRTTAPNLKGKVIVGWDPADTDYNEVGKTGGEKKHILTATEMPPHTHGYTITGAGNGIEAGNDYGLSGGTTASTGGTNGVAVAHENRQPFEVACFIIRYK